jgi:glycosyltransferase 2 family protein
MLKLRRLLALTLFGVLLYAGFVLYTGYTAIEQSLAGFQWSALALTLLLSCTNYGLRFLKWQYYLARLGIRHVPVPDSLLVFLSGFVLSITPGKVGEVFKSAVLARTHGVPLERTAPIVIAERLTDVIGVIVLVVIGSSGFGGGLYWAVIGSLLVALGLSCILWEAPARWGVAALGKVPRLAPLVPRFDHAVLSLRRVASLDALALPVVLSIVGWGLEGVGLHTLLHGFGASLALTFSLFFYATATLAGAIIPVPGGLGVTEALMQEQLVRIGGVAPGVATASMILIRLCTLWWAVAVGFAALGCLRLRFPALGRAAPAKAAA